MALFHWPYDASFALEALLLCAV